MFPLILLVVLILTLLILYNSTRKNTRRWKNLSKFPGSQPFPLIGNALEIGFDADEASHKLMNMWKKYGKGNFRVQVGTEDWVFLSDADDIGIMLNHPTELGKPLERNTAFLPFFGNSVSTSEGERWRSTRKLLSPSFLYKTLENRIDVINVNTERLFNIFDDYVDKGSIDMYRYLRPFMFDILCDSLMGVNLNLLDNPDHHYLNASAKVIRIITHNYFSYWRNIRPLFVLTSLYREMMDTIKSLRDTSTEIMAKRRKKLQKIIEDTKIINENVHTEVEKIIEEKDDMCLLDKFILSKSIIGDSLPDEFINEEISLICFTGHYTTTMTVSHTLYCLAKYPEVQKRVYEEQMSVFDNDISRKLTHHDLSEMKYLEAVIKESIRVIPTVTKIGRQLKNDVVLKDGRIIPAGSSVIVFLEAMSVNPKVFSEPEEYNPDRFNNNIHQFAFVPFSAGPRGCIGFRYAWVVMKTTISNILRNYEILPGEPGTEPQFKYRIITESVNGVKLRLKKRVH